MRPLAVLHPEPVEHPDFEALVADYILWMTRRRLAANTIRLRTFYVRKLEAWLPTHILTASLDDLEAYSASRPWSAATQQTVIGALKSFYSWAYRNELTPRNVAADLLDIRVHVKRSRIATDAKIVAGLEAARTAADAAMIRLGAECGLRVAEIANLKLTNRDDDFLVIVGKGGRERTLHIEPELMALLIEIESTSMRHGNYFPGQSGTPMHPSTVWRHIRALCDTNTHSLRHRAGTVVYRASGHDLRLTQEFLGHSSPVITARYCHVEDDDLRRAGGFARLVDLTEGDTSPMTTPQPPSSGGHDG